MSASTSHRTRTAIAVALLIPLLASGAALAQSKEDRGGFAVRELSVSSGYAFVELPPITLAGYLPLQVLEEDLITSGTAAIDWNRVTHRTAYSMNLLGTYTARTRYSELNSPGASLTFGVNRAVGRRWQLGAGVASGITSSDQLAAQPVSTRRRIDDATSFEELAGTVAVVRSPSPVLADAALFVPISQSFDASEVSGRRSLVGSAKVGATYVHSVRWSTNVHGAYTNVRDISSHETRSTLTSTDATTESASAGVTYNRTERTQITADVTWSQTDGITTDKVVSGTIGYGWSGRKWFMRTTVGAGVRPFAIERDFAVDLRRSSSVPTFIYSGAIGYKFSTQTVLVQYSRAPHDEYGHGGRNTTTGFEGIVESVLGSWSWVPPRGRWTARADFSLTRRPGNFSYINAWLGTAGVGRQFGPNLRVMGELLYDRHGSRGFEGFHLTRTGARINLVWTMPRRAVASETSEQ
jgi:hypothetical protein